MRKIIKQGHNALTLTLPTDWVKRLGLKPKDEVEIVEEGKQLIVNAKKNNEKRCVELQIDSLRIPILWKYISTAYREGYDQIILKFTETDKKYEDAYSFLTAYSKDPKIEKTKKNIKNILYSMTDRFIGMEITEFRDGICIMEQMEESSDKQFDNSLKRIFFLINQLFKDAVTAFENSDFTLLEEVHLTDVNLDKFHDFCCRILNKTGSKNPQKAQIIFTTLFILELLSDEFKAISSFLFGKKKLVNKKIFLDMIKAVFEQFEMYHKLYYNFKNDDVIKTYDRCFDLFKDFPEMKFKSGKNEEEVVYHLRKISEYTYTLIELRIEMEYCNNGENKKVLT